jgi:hypothetical protein
MVIATGSGDDNALCIDDDDNDDNSSERNNMEIEALDSSVVMNRATNVAPRKNRIVSMSPTSLMPSGVLSPIPTSASSSSSSFYSTSPSSPVDPIAAIEVNKNHDAGIESISDNDEIEANRKVKIERSRSDVGFERKSASGKQISTPTITRKRGRGLSDLDSGDCILAAESAHSLRERDVSGNQDRAKTKVRSSSSPDVSPSPKNINNRRRSSHRLSWSCSHSVDVPPMLVPDQPPFEAKDRTPLNISSSIICARGAHSQEVRDPTPPPADCLIICFVLFNIDILLIHLFSLFSSHHKLRTKL